MTLEPILARELCPRKGLLTVLTGLLLASPWAVAQQGREDPADSQPFRIDVNLVTLRFTVTDTRGDFANSLSAEDFVVEENGKPVEIEIFEKPRDQSAVSSDLWLAFLIDVSGSTFATRTEEIVAAQTFLDNLTPATRIGVFGFTEELLPFQTFTSDRNLVLKAIGQARRHLGKTAIYASLDRLVSLTSGTAPAGSPKAVILISDGLDPSHGEAEDSARRALEAGFAVYTIRVPSSAQVYIGPNPNPKEKSLQNSRRQRNEKQIKAFQQLAPLTGGRSFSGFETILDFDNTLAEINDHLFGNLYRVGYYRDSSLGPNVLERVQVRPRRGDLRIASAFKKLPRQFDAKRSLLRVFFDTSGESTVHGLAPVRFQELGADMDVLRQISEGSLVGLPFRLKVNPYSFRGAMSDGVQTQLGVLGLLLDQQGREVVRLREIIRITMDAREVRNGRGIIYSNRLLAPPGAYTLQVALLELSTWRLTSFTRAVTIRADGS